MAAFSAEAKTGSCASVSAGAERKSPGIRPHAVVDAGNQPILEIGRILAADAAFLLHDIDRRNGNFQHFGVFDFFVHKKISFFPFGVVLL